MLPPAVARLRETMPGLHIATTLGETDDAYEAMRAQKRLCKVWEETTLAESVRVSIDEFAHSYDTDEPNRRVAALRAARRKKE